MTLNYESRNELVVHKENRVRTSTTSRGNQIKWKVDNLWIKADNRGYEGLAEAASSFVLEASNIDDYAEYKMGEIIELGEGNYIGCVSTDFLNDRESLITLDRLFKKNGIDIDKNTREMSTEQLIEHVVNEVIKITGIGNFGEWLGKLIEFDALVLNEDRHLNNIAVISDVKTNKFKVTPVFDNGLSLLSDIGYYPMRMNLAIDIRKVKSKPFSTRFDKQVNAVKKMYGQNLKVDRGVLNFNTEHITLYTREQVNRVEEVLRMQMDKYSYLLR